VCALESTDAAVGLRRFHRTVCRVTTAWIEQVALGKDNLQLDNMHRRLTVNCVWKVLKRGGGVHNILQLTERVVKKNMRYDFLQNKQEIFPVLGHRSSNRVLPNINSLTSSSRSLLH